MDSSATKLAAAVATAPGTVLLKGPTDTAVGGFPAKYVVLAVRRARRLRPRILLHVARPQRRCALAEDERGDTIRVWVVDLGRKLLFFEAETTTQASRALEREVQQIVRSIRFY